MYQQPPDQPGQQPPAQPGQQAYPQQQPFVQSPSQPPMSYQPSMPPPPASAQSGIPQPFIAQSQPSMAPPQMINATTVNVNIQQKGPGFLLRALYFICIGWWVGFFWLNLGFALCGLIVTLPLGLYMLNRLPQIMTLKQPGTSTKVNVTTSSTMVSGAPGMAPGMVQTTNVNVSIGGTQQRNFFLRALYYVCIGFWLGYLWAVIAYLCCITIILIPVGVMMFDRLPAVLTLRRN